MQPAKAIFIFENKKVSHEVSLAGAWRVTNDKIVTHNAVTASLAFSAMLCSRFGFIRISHTGGAVVRLCEAESQVTDLAYRPPAEEMRVQRLSEQR